MKMPLITYISTPSILSWFWYVYCRLLASSGSILFIQDSIYFIEPIAFVVTRVRMFQKT